MFVCGYAQFDTLPLLCTLGDSASSADSAVHSHLVYEPTKVLRHNNELSCEHTLGAVPFISRAVYKHLCIQPSNTTDLTSEF